MAGRSPSALRPPALVGERLASLERENLKLRRINDALMNRVERSTDLQGNAFSLFERAIALEEKVRARTADLEFALGELAAGNAATRQAKEAAEHAERRLSDAIESINEGFALFDADDRLVLCNQTYLSFWPRVADRIVPGVKFSDIVRMIREDGTTIGSLLTPDRWMSERINRHRVADSSHVQALADGRYIQINELRTTDGGIVGVYTDITDVKVEDARDRARELAQRASELQATLDAIPEGVCLFDESRRPLAWNGALVTMLALNGESLAEFSVHGELVAAARVVAPDIDLGWRDPTAGPASAEGVLADGRMVEIRRGPLPGGGMILSLADITERRQVAEALRQANDELERRVIERTVAMEEAKTAAEQANSSKTRFLAAASHDLLQPLNAARLFVSALEERALQGDVRTLVSQTGSALNSVEELLESLLEISKLDAGGTRPEISRVRLADLFRALGTEAAPIAAERGVRLEVADTPLAVRSDSRLLRRIIQNLLSNALRYTDEGGVYLTAERRGDEVWIEVRDTGHGIDPRHHAAIFEEFRRFDASNSHGMGLGLAIVQRAALVLGHCVSVDSEPGSGSRFTIRAPFAESREIPAPAPARSRRAIRARRVLVIDNEPTILDGMRALLGGWGCEVDVALSGTEALKRLAESTTAPDVLIADYHLGDEFGDAVVTRLRETLGAEIPAMIITADRSPELREALEAAGLHQLNKPIRPAQLRALLSRLEV